MACMARRGGLEHVWWLERERSEEVKVDQGTQRSGGSEKMWREGKRGVAGRGGKDKDH